MSSASSSVPVLTVQDGASTSQRLYRQANAISRSAQNLNLFQKRLIVLGLSEIDHTSATPTLTVDVPVHLFERFGVENPYHRARQAATALLDTRIIINREGGGFEAYSWVNKVSYMPVGDPANDKDYSFIRLEFHEELRPYLTNLKAHYAQLPIADVVSLPSITAIRLYELLATLSMSGRRRSVEVELMQLKHSLGMVEQGSRPGTWVNEKQKQWRDFRKSLIRIVDTLHEYTGMRVEFQGIRVGRRIGKVGFDVSMSAKNQTLLASTDDDATDGIKARLDRLGFQGNVDKLLQDHSTDTVEAAIAITEKRAGEGNIRNPGGFLRSVLRDGSAAAEAKDAKRDREGASEPEDASNEREAAVADGDLFAAWRAYRSTAARDLVASEGLTREEILTIVRSDYGEHPIFRGLLEEIEQTEQLEAAPQVQSSLFTRYEEGLADEVLDFEAFKRRPILHVDPRDAD